MGNTGTFGPGGGGAYFPEKKRHALKARKASKEQVVLFKFSIFPVSVDLPYFGCLPCSKHIEICHPTSFFVNMIISLIILPDACCPNFKHFPKKVLK